MSNKEFKKIFDSTAKSFGFEYVFDGWFKESSESIVVLDLQKSRFGDYYELNIKIYIQGIFGIHYKRNKNLVKKDTGDAFRRKPPEYKSIFDFEKAMESAKRKEGLKKFFDEFLTPFTDKALSKSGIIQLAKEGKITLLPAIKDALS